MQNRMQFAHKQVRINVISRYIQPPSVETPQDINMLGIALERYQKHPLPSVLVKVKCGTAYKCLLLSRVYCGCCDTQIQNDVASRCKPRTRGSEIWAMSHRKQPLLSASTTQWGGFW
jgi:hypothetical protein